MKFLYVFFIIATLAFSGLTALLYFFQSRLIFFPVYNYASAPDRLGIEFEDVMFRTDDGLNLTGWYIPGNNADNVLLFCHGNAGNISHRIDYIRIFHELGLNMFIFDYRGYGKSEGKPDEEGTYRDVLGAWNFLVNEKDFTQESILLYGRSLGGAIAAWLAQDHTPLTLILDSSFTSITALGSELYPFLPIRLLSRFNYTTQLYLEKVSSPVLVIHSRQDEIVPFEHSISLFENASQPKEFLEISGSHNEGFLESWSTYESGLRDYISKITLQQLPPDKR